MCVPTAVHECIRKYVHSVHVSICTCKGSCALYIFAISIMFLNYSYSATPMPFVTSEDNETCVSSPANVTIRCHWYGPSYYVAWYKDGGPIYSEDLSVPNVTMEASDGFVVKGNYSSRTSTLTILSSSIDDSGNYTCAVSCRARNVSFDAIPPEVTDSIVVSVYGEHVYMYCTFKMFSCQM